jgi:hypothetical protein
VLNDEDQAAVAGLPLSRMKVAAHRDVVRLGERVEHAWPVEDGLVGRFGQTETGAR